VRDRGAGGRGGARGAAGHARPAARYAVARGGREHQDLADGAGGPAALVARRGDRLYAAALGGTRAIPGRRPHPPRYERRGTRPACSGYRPEEPLRVTLRARDPRGSALLYTHRVGEAGRRGAGGVPRRGDAPGDREPRHGHTAPGPGPELTPAAPASPASLQNITVLGQMGRGEHVPWSHSRSGQEGGRPEG